MFTSAWKPHDTEINFAQQRQNVQRIAMECILESIITGLRASARLDSSPVSIIVSDSPTITKIDFLSTPLPSPPKFEDEGLQAFAQSLQRASRYVLIIMTLFLVGFLFAK